MLKYEELPEVNSERWLSLEDFEGEIWKDVKGFEGRYLVSNYGRIRSFDTSWEMKRETRGTALYKKKGRILRLIRYNPGYYRVCLVDVSRNIHKTPSVHRLVAEAFIPNPNNYRCVNHKDENKANNYVFINKDGSINPDKTNLEWCTHRYNNTYGNRIQKCIKKSSHPVNQYDLNGILINTFNSIKDASRKTGISTTDISFVCNNKRWRKTTHGYIFRFANTD